MNSTYELLEAEAGLKVENWVLLQDIESPYTAGQRRGLSDTTCWGAGNTLCGKEDTLHELTIGIVDERRGEPRYVIRKPLILIPVLTDGSPDWEHRVRGASLDLSLNGIGLEYDAPAELPTTAAVLLLEDRPDLYRCAGLDICHTRPMKRGRFRAGCRFGGFAHEILRPENLNITFDSRSLNLTLGLSEELLHKWAAVGVIQPGPNDPVHLCPRCHSLPTFRYGCQSCGSGRLTQDRLIHHFACAHIGFLHDFEVGQELICPKCRMRPLVVGTDFEYTQGPYRCLDCQWTNTEREHVAQCLKCGLRFPGHQAHESELRGFCAHRLDPLALLPAS